MKHILEARNISKSFPGVKALDGVNLAVRPGAVHAVVGENGAGKSTLMKILSGVYTEYEGEVLVDGRPVTFSSPREAEAAGIAIIHQELNLVPALSVGENIFLGREPARYGLVDFAALNREASALLEQLGHPMDPRAPIATLKISDQQLVEIAKALSLDANVIVMDEPTTALSSDDVERLFAIIRTLTELGKAIVYISHKMDELFRIADEFTVLRDGQLVGWRRASEIDQGELIRMMVGREISQFYSPHEAKIGEDLLRVENLGTRHYGGRAGRGLSDVGFTLRAGEILGVGGLMGAGRTELLECLFGARAVDASTAIEIGGARVRVSDPKAAIRAGIAFVSEDRKGQGLVLDMGVGRNITLAVLRQFTRLGFIRGAAEQTAAREYAARLQVKTPRLSTPVGNLSGGNQQKVVLAKWLMTAPRVLLLDEPTKGIDVAAKA
jgi:ribose transport system ATP-binding protein